MGAYQNYTIGFVTIIFAVSMITTFSGSIFKTYDTNISSKSLNEIKSSAQAAQPSVGTQKNRTESISPEESSFLSPQAFGIIGDTLSSAGNLLNIISAVEKEVGLPKGVAAFLIGIITLRLIWEGISALFGWDV